MVRFLALLVCLLSVAPAVAEVPLEKLRLPAGFTIEVYADVPGARHLGLDAQGTLYVGTAASSVYAVPDKNHDGRADEVLEVLKGLNRPNGVAVLGQDLYVGEVHRIQCYPGLTRRLKSPPAPRLVLPLPQKNTHGLRVLRFGPDGRLYVGIGAPCNVCEVTGLFGTICRMKPDGSKFEVVARGVRNSMGFDWHPATKELWFTDNGRDFLGDDAPPDELNRAPKPGLHFGFPYRWGANQPDPQFGAKAPAGLRCTPPALALEAHVAPLGMRFYRGSMFGAAYKNAVLMANHGSWNRTTPIGYRILAVNPATLKRTVLVEGWLQNGKAWGRPVDIQELADGSVAVSDDRAGKVYRVRYAAPRR